MAELFAKKDKLRQLTITSVILLLSLYSFAKPSQTQAKPPLAHGKVYQKTEDLENYWVSEKLDGVRAYWDGQQLISRQGNPYHAPGWFIAEFPDQPLDGELWIARSSFEQLVSTVRKKQPLDEEWQKVKYMIFDLPASKNSFTDRLAELKVLLRDSPAHLHLIEQYKVSDHHELQTKLDQTIKAGGEGLMLHKADTYYKTGRSDDILKVKTYQDAEAKVIAHLPGKGKYKGMLGALLVEIPNGKQFKIGSGFKDKERQNPPAIGTTITYKYYGLSRKGIPKFASFLRVKKRH